MKDTYLMESHKFTEIKNINDLFEGEINEVINNLQRIAEEYKDYERLEIAGASNEEVTKLLIGINRNEG
ncbi:MAG: hypothetical protein GY861_07610 [bacterium]|nr:hypothetical protein [bacterium]